jgi:hypothetical protein
MNYCYYVIVFYEELQNLLVWVYVKSCVYNIITHFLHVCICSLSKNSLYIICRCFWTT